MTDNLLEDLRALWLSRIDSFIALLGGHNRFVE